MTKSQFQSIYARIQHGHGTVLDYVLALLYLNANLNVPENVMRKKRVLKLFILNVRYKFYANEPESYDILSDLEKDMIKAILSGCDVDTFLAYSNNRKM